MFVYRQARKAIIKLDYSLLSTEDTKVHLLLINLNDYLLPQTCVYYLERGIISDLNFLIVQSLSYINYYYYY